MVGDVDPGRLFAAAERLFGPRTARFIGQVAVISGVLLVVGAGGVAFFGWFIGDLIVPFLGTVFGTDYGVTLDNIEAVIAVLVGAVVFFVLIFAIFVWAAIHTFRRRVVPLPIIDALAEFRSEGITVLNDLPEKRESMSESDKEAFVEAWRTKWKAWAGRVSDFLGKNFTKAEQLAFSRLGVVPEARFGMSLNPRHAHYLMQLAKQLTILENTIERHLERH